MSEKGRIEYIDIAKGIGIILMVMGHSLNMESKLRTFIYLFIYFICHYFF